MVRETDNEDLIYIYRIFFSTILSWLFKENRKISIHLFTNKCWPIYPQNELSVIIIHMTLNTLRKDDFPRIY